jgi:HEAT repeat protein
MGLFDFLRKSSPPPASGAPVDKKVASLAKVAADKRAQTYDRLEAIQALVAMQTSDAAAALLKRFSFSIDPSITDQEEKELAYQGIVAAGKEAVPAVREHCARSDTLTWPIKVLRALLDDDEYRDALVDLLDRFDTEYARNVEPKVQVISALEEIASGEVREAVEPFLEDVNETVRFHAVQTTFAQGDAESVPSLVKLVAAEESVRVKNKVAEGLAQRAWVIAADLRDVLRKGLADTTYGVSIEGKVVRGRG